MYSTLGISIVTIGLAAMLAAIGWHVWAGLRLKHQVDKDYEHLRAIDRAREASLLSSITR